MISSRLNPKIKYEKTEKINAKDVGQELNLYEYEIFPETEPIMIAVGVKQKHAKDDTFYYHYLYATLDPEKKGKFQKTVGVLEIEKDKYLNVLDEDGDLDIDKIKPLLFIDEKGLTEIQEKQRQIIEKQNRIFQERELELEKNEIPISIEENNDEKSLLEPIINPNPLSKTQNNKILLEGKTTITKGSQHVETKEEAQTNIENYKKETGSHEWIQERMKNTNYSIIEIPGDGNCFFHVVCQAFASVGLQTTVSKLREYLSNHNSVEKTFKQEQQIFSEFNNLYALLTRTNETIMARLEEISSIIKKEITDADKENLTKEKRTLLEKKRRNDEKIQDVKQDIEEIVPHMKKLKTLSDYREYIKTSQFWANEWAIETLEKKLQVKFIIFPKEGDKIYTVGTLNKPNRYILVAFVSGNHYELIQYNQTKIFLSFDALPYSVRCLGVKNKFKISDFINFRCEIGGEELEEETEDEEIKGGESFEKIILANDGKPHIFKKSQLANYFELRRKHNKGWERILSDDFIVAQPLEIDGLKWNSVSHYVMAGNFHSNSSFYKNFSAESQTLISSNVEIARKAVETPGDYSFTKKRNSKDETQKITDKNLLFVPIKNVHRETLTEERKNKRREIAWITKLKNPVIRHLLISTRDARLFQNDFDKEDTLLEKLREKQNITV